MYTLEARIDFADKYDETIKYKAGEKLIVDEERALELLSSNTPVVKYVSRDIDISDKDNLVKEANNLKEENAKLTDDKNLLKTTVETLKNEIETLEKENKELKAKKKTEDKETSKGN